MLPGAGYGHMLGGNSIILTFKITSMGILADAIYHDEVAEIMKLKYETTKL